MPLRTDLVGLLSQMGYEASLPREGEEWWIVVELVPDAEALSVPVVPELQ